MAGEEPPYRMRKLLLFSDSGDIARQIEQSLAGYGLSHDIRWIGSIDEFHSASLSFPGVAPRWPDVDLCLIAYVNDAQRTRQTLLELRQLVRWKLVPVVVFVPPEEAGLAQVLYHLGANSVLPYPLSFESLKALLQTMDRYWFEVVSLPPRPDEPQV